MTGPGHPSQAGFAGDPKYVPLAEDGQPQPGQQQPEAPLGDRCKACCCNVLCWPFYLILLSLFVYLTYKCRYLYIETPPTSSALLPYMEGRDTFHWWNMPKQRSEEQLEWCRSQLSNPMPLYGLQYGFLPGASAPEVLYRCTKVPAIFEEVPEPLRGVFWMKDNAMNEELAVLQFGRWFEGQRIYIMPASPFSWAWAGADGTKPNDAPFNGNLYGEYISKFHMDGLAGGHQSQTYAFSTCPGGEDLPFPWGEVGHACVAGSGSTAELTFANLEAHYWGNLSVATQTGLYTLESVGPNAWYRGIYGPVPVIGDFFKGCNCWSVGSYNLRRILDGDGNPVEPYHSEWVAYIGQANLAVWYDYSDPASLELLKQGKFDEAKKLLRSGPGP